MACNTIFFVICIYFLLYEFWLAVFYSHNTTIHKFVVCGQNKIDHDIQEVGLEDTNEKIKFSEKFEI